MKKILFLSLCCLFILGCKSCEEEMAPQLTRGCGNGFVPNEGNTDCICPTETHYVIAPLTPNPSNWTNESSKNCQKKGKFVYYVSIGVNNCILGLSDEFLALNPKGIWWINEQDTANGHEYWPHMHFIEEKPSSPFFYETTVEEHDDTTIEISFVTDYLLCAECLDWVDKTELSYVRGYGHGVSNVGNTEMDIEIIYKGSDGLVVDTGYLHLWKE